MQFLITVLLDGLIYASYLFIVSLGLTITFGVMKILNVAHGGFFAWGAYLASISIIYLGDNEYNSMLYYFSIFLSAIIVGLFFGYIIERFILRKMYNEDIHLIVLATFGLFWILEDLILHVFGVDPLMPYYPAMELGGIEIAGIFQGVYSLTLAGLAIVVAFICWYFLKKTKYGKLLQSVIFDREVSVSMGINVTRVYLITFIIGGMLGALGGAYIAPTISVSPGFAIDVVVMSFAVVVIGGMGSVPGALIGSLIVGLVRAFAVHQAPILELFIIYAIMAIVLIIKPEGLFAPPKPRKI
ncbi:MAG: branched-chain amino acid ABC transporter permease [SAR116 cluster bacterium]|nr:branched-chain amino acid ABC transporter permease [SAR116 cluster bacterium]RPH11648.1 MAG: branched-chain amino acid ABC transporter permease [Alphaproteobacteria bacterium TMED54]